MKNQILIYGGLTLLILTIIYLLLKRIGLIKTVSKSEKKEQREIQRLKESNIWEPTYFVGKPSSVLFSSSYARSLASDIKNALGFINDDEQKIYGVFRKIKNKVNVSQIANEYLKKYGEDLEGELKASLSKKELDNIYLIISTKP